MNTSYEALQTISSTLSRRQAEVLECLKVYGAMTNLEIARKMGREINTITPRIYELRRKGLVCSAGSKIDVTGHRAMVWVLVYAEELF